MKVFSNNSNKYPNLTEYHALPVEEKQVSSAVLLINTGIQHSQSDIFLQDKTISKRIQQIVEHFINYRDYDNRSSLRAEVSKNPVKKDDFEQGFTDLIMLINSGQRFPATLNLLKNFFTRLGSSLIAINRKIRSFLAWSFSVSLTNSGNSTSQGPHQVAQK